MERLWKDQKRAPATYSSLLKQHETHEPDIDRMEIVSEAGEQHPSRKHYIWSLALNAVFAISLVCTVYYYKGGPVCTVPRLLESPVPNCRYSPPLALVNSGQLILTVPNEVKTFKLDTLFLSLPSEESNTAWESLPGPNGRGFINLDSSVRSKYPDSKAGLSVFHQLHCVGALRGFMWDLIYERHNLEELRSSWPANASSPTYHEATQGLWHYAHCFDYLRQGIQCSGDTSLEFVTGNTGEKVVDGLDYPHECKSWEAIWDYAVQYG